MRARIIIIAAALLVSASGPAVAERIKDVASVQGVRSNPLIGYGLVVGLSGTGDQTSQTPFTVQSMKSMLAQLGITVPANVNPQLKNVAAVAIQAELPAFAKPGQVIDITVASIGNSASLRGGSLLMSPLKGADGQVYAIAQGNIIVGGLGVEGKDGSKVSVNIPSAGRIPRGATVEREVPVQFHGGELLLNVHQADFTTTQNLVQAINGRFGSGMARAVDPVTVSVQAPADPASWVAFVSEVENLDMQAGDAPARVIVNARTGTVVINRRVMVTPAAVAHGTLTVSITENTAVSQPEAFSRGQTVAVPQSNIEVNQSGTHLSVVDPGPGADLNQIVRAINQIGASPGDLVAILEALKQAGALHAELVVI